MMLLWHRAALQFDPKRSQVNLRVVADKFSLMLTAQLRNLENPKM
jgi:hypothetical protein